jgi:hypothetical protein
MRCPECGQEIDGIDYKKLMLPDIWWIEAFKDKEKEFTLPVSGLTATVKDGKIHLSGKGLTPKVLITDSGNETNFITKL